MQSLHRGRALAGLLTKRILPRRPVLSQHSRFFTSSPHSLVSHLSATARPKPATMDSVSVAVRSLRRYGQGGWQPNRFQSTKRMNNIFIAMNFAVFGAWVYGDAVKDLRLQQFLMNNATLSWYNARAQRYWTLVTSAFSHKDFTHILFNMLSFSTFSSVLVWAGGVGVGPAHVLALTLGSAVAGSAAWLYQKQPQGRDKRWGPWGEHGLASTRQVGLGASGVVMGFAAVATCLAPMLPMRLFLLPFELPMFMFTGAYFAVDLFYLNTDDRIGRSAHLGGAVFGVAYYLVALRRYGGIAQLLSRRRFR